eukprot:snap_masked-scaffold1622_size33238-processed-gene-0.5 protein:Tk00865 transcript:snap_masked-scaffold1622_size33238-processed-gene-0.5-mRNA-1 annotation:"upf0485 protein c1orf144-like protein"
MWSTNPRHASPAASAQPHEAVDEDWEDLFDSGQLDARLQLMRVQPVETGYYGPPQTARFQQPPPASRGYGGGPANGLLPTPNPGLMLPPPLPGGRARGAPFSMPPPPIVARSTGLSTPPFPYGSGFQPQILSRGSALGLASSTGGGLTVVPRPPQLAVRPVITAPTENGLHTEYVPPEPKLKILKRPSSSPGNLAGQGGGSGSTTPTSGKARPKTLRQREEEYAQARLRILGSRGEEPEDIPEGGEVGLSNGHSEPGTPSPPSRVVRTPRGPDGTPGFGLASDV